MANAVNDEGLLTNRPVHLGNDRTAEVLPSEFFNQMCPNLL